MRQFYRSAAVVLLFFFSSCATIPQESVNLSSEVGVGLQKQHQSQVELVNLYFAEKRKRLDEAMSRATNTYFEALTPSGSITLNRDQLRNVASDVIEISNKNNAAKEELEKVRVLLIKKLDENYLILNQAQASITGLLQSAVQVERAQSEAYEKLSVATSGSIDLDKIFNELDDFVLKGGEKAEEAMSFMEKVKSILNERGG